MEKFHFCNLNLLNMGFSTKGIVAMLIPHHNYFAIDIIANMFFGNVELLWQDEKEANSFPLKTKVTVK